MSANNGLDLPSLLWLYDPQSNGNLPLEMVYDLKNMSGVVGQCMLNKFAAWSDEMDDLLAQLEAAIDERIRKDAFAATKDPGVLDAVVSHEDGKFIVHTREGLRYSVAGGKVTTLDAEGAA